MTRSPRSPTRQMVQLRWRHRGKWDARKRFDGFEITRLGLRLAGGDIVGCDLIRTSILGTDSFIDEDIALTVLSKLGHADEACPDLCTIGCMDDMRTTCTVNSCRAHEILVSPFGVVLEWFAYVSCPSRRPPDCPRSMVPSLPSLASVNLGDPCCLQREYVPGVPGREPHAVVLCSLRGALALVPRSESVLSCWRDRRC